MKVDAEGKCRVCDARGRLEAAHTISRKNDPKDGTVQPDDIVPLCPDCHRKYDAHALNLLPYMSIEEQAAATRHVGIARAMKRLYPLELYPLE